jgi:threonine dehydratase
VIGFEDVLAAAERLAGIVHRTPVVTSRTLDERTGASAYLKCENLQRMGAFKIRGAYNRIAQLTPEQRARGVVAFSSGNHAQGVALAAKLLGVPATIVMPADAPAFDDADVIAGAGTVALELLQDVPQLDVLLVCTGGGGLLAGCALAATALRPGIAIYGVEPEAGDDFQQSFASGERVEIPVPVTIADGQQTTSPGKLTFPIVMRSCAGILTVSDDQLRDAMRFAFERLKLVMEPSGASALAALLSGAIDARGKHVGIIVSGGNVDPAHYASILNGGTAL